MGTSTKILFLLIATATTTCALDQHNSENSTTADGRGPGYPVEVVDPQNDPQVQKATSFAFETHLESLKDGEPGRHFLRVVTAQKQVVAGTKYILELELGASNCTQGQQLAQGGSHYCSLNPQRGRFICKFEVLEQPWLGDQLEVLGSQCHPNFYNLVYMGSLVSEEGGPSGHAPVIVETTYFKSKNVASWYVALAECNREGSTLVNIESQREFNHINQLIVRSKESSSPSPFFWTGGRLDPSLNSFQWGNGLAVGQWTRWTQSSYWNSPTYNTRVQILTTGGRGEVPRFQTRDYTDAQRFICERKVRGSG